MNLNVDHLFALPTKAYLQQATNENCFSQKSFCAAAQKCFGYLHDGVVADSKIIFAAKANNDLRYMQQQFHAEALNDLR